MKKFFLFAIFFVIGVSVFANHLNLPLAKVSLHKTEIINTSDFLDELKMLNIHDPNKLTSVMQMKLLTNLVNNALIMQAATKQGISVSEQEITQYAKQAFGQAAQKMTDTQFLAQIKMVLAKQGLTWNKFHDMVKKSLMTKKYIQKNAKDAFKDIKQPTTDQVKSYYEANKIHFVSPNMVRWSDIEFAFAPNISKAKLKQEAEKVEQKLKKGNLSFANAVDLYSSDPVSAGKQGDFGFVPDTPNSLYEKYLGKDLIQKLFTYKVGQVTGVLQGNRGYYIGKITDKKKAKQLTLTDRLGPNKNSPILADYIKQRLYAGQMAMAYQKAMQQVLAQLKVNADIEIYSKNLAKSLGNKK